MLFENIFSSAVYLINILAIGVLSWCAFKEKERGDEYRKSYLEAMQTILDLEDELKHSHDLAWNRLSDAQKDAAIRMG